jgi:hypothetical protein
MASELASGNHATRRVFITDPGRVLAVPQEYMYMAIELLGPVRVSSTSCTPASASTRDGCLIANHSSR